MIGMRITHDGPRSGIIKYLFGRLYMTLSGWDVVGKLPPEKKFVLIGAPHTSNWDFPLTIASVYILRLRITWLGKHTLFRRPFGFMMRFLGGLAIKRESSSGVVEQLCEKFAESERMVIALTPSGTRKKQKYWKSGFYWIALKARVPLVLGYIDYRQKKTGIGISFLPTGDIRADMDKIRAFYRNISGKYPDQVTTVLLVDEEK